MSGWWRRVRAALGMGSIWAGGGAAIGGLVEFLSNLFPTLPVGFIDMWIQTLAIPGFLGGVSFSLVLGLLARDRRFDELSLPFVVGLGLIGGALLGGLLIALGLTPLILVPAILLSGVGASMTLGLARMATRFERLEGVEEGVERLRASDPEAE